MQSPTYLKPPPAQPRPGLLASSKIIWSNNSKRDVSRDQIPMTKFFTTNVHSQASVHGGQALTNEGALGPTVTSGGVPGQTVASGGNPEASANFPGAATMPPAQTTGTLQGELYSVGSNGLVVIDGTSFNTATPTAATLRGGKVVVVWPTGSVSIQEAQDRAPSKKIAITPKEYIIGSFVPTILAVVYSIPWHLLASAIQAIEPFYQLQRPEGVTAQDSIALDYRASGHHKRSFPCLVIGLNIATSSGFGPNCLADCFHFIHWQLYRNIREAGL